MPSENQLLTIRKAFHIPESVTIIAASKISASFNKPLEAKKQNYNVPQGDPKDEALYTSLLGTPVYSSIEFNIENGEYETSTPGVFKQVPPQRYEAVLITVTQSKKIITTEIQGRDGTVKEYIGMDDYTVQVNGVITGSNGHHPADEVANLKKLLEAPVSIQVSCKYLQAWDISNLVVFEYEAGQETGGYSYQTFSITFKSDIPQELRITGI